MNAPVPMKLPKTQQVLRAALHVGVQVYYVRYPSSTSSGYYFRADTGQKVTAAANGLRDRNLARLVGDRLVAT